MACDDSLKGCMRSSHVHHGLTLASAAPQVASALAHLGARAREQRRYLLRHLDAAQTEAGEGEARGRRLYFGGKLRALATLA